MGILGKEVCRCKALSKGLPAGVIPPSQRASALGECRLGKGCICSLASWTLSLGWKGRSFREVREPLLPSPGTSPRASKAGTGALGQKKKKKQRDRKEKDGGQTQERSSRLVLLVLCSSRFSSEPPSLCEGGGSCGEGSR